MDRLKKAKEGILKLFLSEPFLVDSPVASLIGLLESPAQALQLQPQDKKLKQIFQMIEQLCKSEDIRVKSKGLSILAELLLLVTEDCFKQNAETWEQIMFDAFLHHNSTIVQSAALYTISSWVSIACKSIESMRGLMQRRKQDLNACLSKSLDHLIDADLFRVPFPKIVAMICRVPFFYSSLLRTNIEEFESGLLKVGFRVCRSDPTQVPNFSAIIADIFQARFDFTNISDTNTNPAQNQNTSSVGLHGNKLSPLHRVIVVLKKLVETTVLEPSSLVDDAMADILQRRRKHNDDLYSTKPILSIMEARLIRVPDKSDTAEQQGNQKPESQSSISDAIGDIILLVSVANLLVQKAHSIELRSIVELSSDVLAVDPVVVFNSLPGPYGPELSRLLFMLEKTIPPFLQLLLSTIDSVEWKSNSICKLASGVILRALNTYRSVPSIEIIAAIYNLCIGFIETCPMSLHEFLVPSLLPFILGELKKLNLIASAEIINPVQLREQTKSKAKSITKADEEILQGEKSLSVMEQHLYNPQVLRSMFRVLRAILSSVSPLLLPEQRNELESVIFSCAFDLETGLYSTSPNNPASSLPRGFDCDQTRLEIFKLVEDCVRYTTPGCATCCPFALIIFRIGTRDRNRKIAKSCRNSIKLCELLMYPQIQPVKPLAEPTLLPLKLFTMSNPAFEEPVEEINSMKTPRGTIVLAENGDFDPTKSKRRKLGPLSATELHDPVINDSGRNKRYDTYFAEEKDNHVKESNIHIRIGSNVDRDYSGNIKYDNNNAIYRDSDNSDRIFKEDGSIKVFYDDDGDNNNDDDEDNNNNNIDDEDNNNINIDNDNNNIYNDNNSKIDESVLLIVDEEPDSSDLEEEI